MQLDDRVCCGEYPHPRRVKQPECAPQPDDARRRRNAVSAEIQHAEQQQVHREQKLIEQAQHEGHQRGAAGRDLMIQLALDQCRREGGAFFRVSDRVFRHDGAPAVCGECVHAVREHRAEKDQQRKRKRRQREEEQLPCDPFAPRGAVQQKEAAAVQPRAVRDQKHIDRWYQKQRANQNLKEILSLMLSHDDRFDLVRIIGRERLIGGLQPIIHKIDGVAHRAGTVRKRIFIGQIIGAAYTDNAPVGIADRGIY